MEILQTKYGRVDKLGDGIHNPGYQQYIRYNFLMAWAIRPIYTSKCVQMVSQQLHVPKTSKVYSICNKCSLQKSVGEGVDTTPLGSRRVNNFE